MSTFFKVCTSILWTVKEVTQSKDSVIKWISETLGLTKFKQKSLLKGFMAFTLLYAL